MSAVASTKMSASIRVRLLLRRRDPDAAARIVDQDVDPARCLQNLCDDPVPVSGGGDIRTEAGHPEVASRRVEGLLIAAGDEDPGPGPDESLRDPASEALGTACHEGGLTVEFKRSVHFLLRKAFEGD